jgi:hypothetical protein
MTKEQIHESLEKMLENPKSKNFLNHLVRAYLPDTNVTKVLKTPSGDFKCVLTRLPLISVDDLVGITRTPEFQDKLKNSSAYSVDEKTGEALRIVTDGRKCGVTGKDTTTFMSDEAYQIFADWVVAKSLKGDKHINWLLGSIKRSTLISRAENIQDTDVQKKVENFKNSGKQRTATFTLADSSDALTKLKASLEANGK